MNDNTSRESPETANQSTSSDAAPAPAAGGPAANGVSGAARRSATAQVIRALMRVIPTVLVLLTLVAAGWYGHRSNWQLPRFSELVGATKVSNDDWCDEHGVAESECLQCLADSCKVQDLCCNTGHQLEIKDYGWCSLHGIHQCPHCHPDVAQVKSPPETSAEESQRISLALAVRPRAENNSGCKQYQNVIQFASMDSVKKAGVDVEPAQRSEMMETVAVNAEINYDQRRLAELSTRVPGSIFWAEKQAGDRVQAGEVLALIDAALVGKTKGDFQQALAQVAFQREIVSRIKPLAESGVVPAKRLQEVEADLSAAIVELSNTQQTLSNLGLAVDVVDFEGLDSQRIGDKLRFLGIPATLQEELTSKTTSANLLPMFASIDGIIIKRHAVIGEVVDSQMTLFELADTSQMWLNFNVPVENTELARLGQKVLFRPDGSHRQYVGQINWISTSIDQATRTLPARAVLSNEDGQLRNEMFGGGQLVLREDPQAVIVPSAALQRDGSCYIVFVREKNYFARENSPKVFYTRSVRTGANKDGYTEIIAGLLPGEVVATVGSDVLRGQLLKSNLGAG